MEREIRFRAWDGQKMIKDFLTVSDNGHFISHTSENSDDYEPMQYTGYNDICEGDICAKTFTEKVGKTSVERTVTGEVVWSNQKAGFVLVVREYVDTHVFNQRHYELNGCKLLGNAYEHPQLTHP
jgi:hypothetical protein